MASSHTNPQPDHSQSKPLPHSQQQHPLQIVHKMPLKAGKESSHSHRTSPSTGGQHVGNHSEEIYRNPRVRKLPPGNNKGTGTSYDVCVYICMCTYMYVTCIGAVSSSKGIHDDLSVLQQVSDN